MNLFAREPVVIPAVGGDVHRRTALVAPGAERDQRRDEERAETQPGWLRQDVDAEG